MATKKNNKKLLKIIIVAAVVVIIGVALTYRVVKITKIHKK